MKATAIVLFGLACSVLGARNAEHTTPVPILKQIDRHNDDGSYSYGYEAADGSFKIETKYPTGEVYGKYGYVDDTGKVREVEYGANKHGFMPAGSDINVAPPTLTDTKGNAIEDGDDGQYKEDPSVYHKDPRYNNGNSYTGKPSSQAGYSASWGSENSRTNFDFTFNNQAWSDPATNTPAYNPPAPVYNPPAPVYNPPTPAYNPAPVYNPPAPVYNPQPAYNQQWSQPQWNNHYNYNYNPQPQPYYFNPSQYITHPAVKNIDYLTGSYSVSYGRR